VPTPGSSASVQKPESLAQEKPSRILVADDDEHIRRFLGDFLRLEGYEVVEVGNGESALQTMAKDPPDLLLLDVMMPGINGIEVCRHLKSAQITRLIPVVVLTAQQDSATKVKALEAGADDFLGKPFNNIELQARVRSLLRLKRYTDEMERVESVLFSLARSVEAKDSYTVGHCERLSDYSLALGKRLGLSSEEFKALERGGILHDIGKVGISDSILLKPGRLTSEEFDTMKQHTLIGERICQPLRSLRHVIPIIRSHHERWDGSGYPDGLAGEAIPLTARILQVADIYDAVTTTRPYHSASSSEDAFALLRSEVQKGWREGRLVEEFFKVVQQEGNRGSVLI
jgi:putative two-component system response regulator